MIRYAYNQQISPPAPFVHVTVRCQETGTVAESVPAQLDIAADRTVIPGRLVAELGLVPLDEIQVAGFGGQIFNLPTYRVDLCIRGLEPVKIEVIAHADEAHAHLGRDLLNRYNIGLLGPKATLEIDS